MICVLTEISKRILAMIGVRLYYYLFNMNHDTVMIHMLIFVLMVINKENGPLNGVG